MTDYSSDTLVVVGSSEKREVSELNAELFAKGRDLIENNVGKRNYCHHMGWAEFGDFIDFLLENYDVKKRGGT